MLCARSPWSISSVGVIQRMEFFMVSPSPTYEDRLFSVALAVSFLTHAVCVACIFYANVHKTVRIPRKAIEMVYQTHAAQNKPLVQKTIRTEDFNERKIKPLPKLLSQKPASDELDLNNPGKKPAKMQTSQKFSSQVKMLDQKRSVTVPVFKAEKITNPKYLNYHDLIRNKIKNRAYLYVDDPRFKTGEVYLTFVLSSKGVLEKIQIIEDKTSADDYLRSIGLRSVKESEPFPPFPGDLKYPELTFNVVISFELND